MLEGRLRYLIFKPGLAFHIVSYAVYRLLKWAGLKLLRCCECICRGFLLTLLLMVAQTLFLVLPLALLPFSIVFKRLKDTTLASLLLKSYIATMDRLLAHVKGKEYGRVAVNTCVKAP